MWPSADTQFHMPGMDDIKALTGATVIEAARLARNRCGWRALISAAARRIHAMRMMTVHNAYETNHKRDRNEHA